MPDLSSDYPQARIPAPLTALLGRQREVAAVGQLLRDPAVRLVTLTGPGGVGKTRLALALAHAATAVERVAFVGLAALSEPTLVIPTIAQALEIAEAGSVPVVERLIAALYDRPSLLVLDNLEQVSDAGPQLACLLTVCPRLTLLITSRWPLHLSGEHEFPVPPLALPDRAAANLEAIGDSDAVQLFVERARAVRPEFALTDDNAAAVAAICARLDGLPLAIELAAARIRLLPPHALLARLDHRLTLLTGGARDLPTRQQTLRSTIAWSYDFLPPPEQQLFRHLAVFAGGWTLEAAGIVIDTGVQDMLDSGLFGGMAALVEQSLVEQPDGEPRFRMLETIREFAAEELDGSGEARDIQRRHLNWCLGLAEWGYHRILGPESRSAVRRLEAEHDNLRTALAWAIDGGDIERGHQLIFWLGRFWHQRGHLSEGRQWCERARESTNHRSPLAHAAVFGIEAYLAWAQGDHLRAAELSEHVFATPRVEIPPAWLADILVMRGLVADDVGDFDSAEQSLHQALALHHQLGDRVLAGFALHGLSQVAYHRGNYALADQLAAAALAEELAVRNAYGIGLVQINLARLARDRGDYERANEVYRDSLALLVDHGGSLGISSCFRGLASIAAANHHHERAVQLYAAADALSEAIGTPLPPPARARHEGAIATLRAAIGDGRFDDVWNEAYALNVEQAVVLALDQKQPTAIEVAADTHPRYGLTERELDVLRRIADGATDREIADALFISVRTVSSHVASILNKVGVSSRAAAAAWAVRHDLA